MALATQCPHCYTSFRVANDQLKLHAGMVRCGSCKQTFNGIEHLLPPGATPKTAPPAAAESQSASDTKEGKLAASTGTNADSIETAPDRIDHHLPSSPQVQITEATPSIETSEGDGSTEEIESFINQDGFTDTLVVAPSTLLITPTEPEFEVATNPEGDHFDVTQKVVFDPDVPAAVRVEPVSTSEHFPALHGESKETPKERIEEENKAEQKEEISTPLTVSPAPEKNRPAKAPGALTASLDFELSKEDREWVDEIAQVHQLELETRAALLDEETDEWSKHEPILPQEDLANAVDDLKPLLDEIGDFEDVAQRPSKKSGAASTQRETQTELASDDSNAEEAVDEKDDAERNKDLHDNVRPGFVLQAERDQRFGRWKRIGLSLGCFLFVVLGLAQSMYFFRSELAAHLPQFKPQLLSICKSLACQIKLPAQKSMLEITGSELLIISEELGINTLSIQIQNKSSTVQAWPHLELTLKDRRGKDLLQKAFTPAQYVDNKDMLLKGMPANSETSQKIFFQLNGLKASDYATDIFYP